MEKLKKQVTDDNAEAWEVVKRHIRCDPDIMGGVPTFVGTRVPVSHVLECLADGMSEKEIVEAFPSLKPKHIPAALKFAGFLSAR